MALERRYWSDHPAVLGVQGNLAWCLDEVGRVDEALVLYREVYANWVALRGVSHESTILSGCNLAISLGNIDCYHDESRRLSRALLYTARQSLGADHNLTLKLKAVAVALVNDSERTRADLRLKQHDAAVTRPESHRRRRPARRRSHDAGRGSEAAPGPRRRASTHA